MAFDSILRRLRKNLITGFIVLIPVGATIYVIKWTLSAVDNIVSPDAFPGFGILVILGVAFLVGTLANNYFGRMIITAGNNVISKIPFLNKVYLGVQQIIDAVFNSKKKVNGRVVLVEFPMTQHWALALVTNEHVPEISKRTGKDMIGVFVPSAPSPSNGYLLYVERSKTLETSMNAETAFKVVMSVGFVNAEEIGKTNHLYSMPPHMKKFNWMHIFRPHHGISHDPRD
jgi:uncharacterized membrane protein